LPNIRLIDAVSPKSSSELKGIETLKNQKVATIKYLANLDPIGPIHRAIQEIKCNLEDIAYEGANSVCDTRLFECQSKSKLEDKFLTPNIRPTKKKISRMLLYPNHSVAKYQLSSFEDEVLIANKNSSSTIKSSLFRMRDRKLVECTVILERKLLTIVDFDNKCTQVFTLLFSYSKLEKPAVLEGITYYPINIHCDREGTTNLYCISEPEQKMWSNYLNGKNSTFNQDAYEYQSVIHRGINTLIQMAINNKTGEKVAIKTINKNLISDASQIKNQIDMLNMVKHQNIVELLETVEDLNSISFVFKYLEGPNLSICMTKPLPNNLIYNIMSAISSAVYSLKEYGIVHRDIELSSIIFSKNDLNSEVKLINFSLLGLCNNGDFLDGFKGSLRFVAPEIISQRKCDCLADVWSLGVVFYAMLSTKLPFEGDSANDVMDCILHKEPDYEKCSLKNRPKEAVDLVRSMLTKDPKQRITIDEVVLHPYFSKEKEAISRVNPKDKLMMFKMFSRSLKNLQDSK
jgi:serine/threonine protein kinase